MRFDTAVGVLFAGTFAFGILLFSTIQNYVADLFSYLLGNVLGITFADIVQIAILGGIVLVIVAVLRKELLYASFDPTGAAASGLPVVTLDYLLLGLVGVTIVVSIQAVGIIMVVAMLPPGAAALWSTVRTYVSIRHRRASRRPRPASTSLPPTPWPPERRCVRASRTSIVPHSGDLSSPPYLLAEVRLAQPATARAADGRRTDTVRLIRCPDGPYGRSEEPFGWVFSRDVGGSPRILGGHRMTDRTKTAPTPSGSPPFVCPAGGELVILLAILAIVALYATDQIAPATSDRQASGGALGVRAPPGGIVTFLLLTLLTFQVCLPGSS